MVGLNNVIDLSGMTFSPTGYSYTPRTIPLFLAAHQPYVFMFELSSSCVQHIWPAASSSFSLAMWSYSTLPRISQRHPKGIDDVLADEIEVVGIFIGVLLVIVAPASFNISGQAGGNVRAVHAVALDDIGDMIAHHRREPARLLARRFQVANPNRCRRHDLIIRHIHPGRLAAGDRLLTEPPHQARIRQLDHESIAAASRRQLAP